MGDNPVAGFRNSTPCSWDAIARGVSTSIWDGVAIIPSAEDIVNSNYQALTSGGRRHGIEGWLTTLESIHVFFVDGGTSEFDFRAAIARSSPLSECASHDLCRNILVQAPLIELLSELPTTRMI